MMVNNSVVSRKGLKQSGFTLLEIMIALAIFAVASSALIRNSSQAVRLTGIIQDRTLAYWIAENHLNQMRSAPRDEENFPGIGSDRFEVTMADRSWEVVMDVEATENVNMRRLIVSVFVPEDLDNSVSNVFRIARDARQGLKEAQETADEALRRAIQEGRNHNLSMRDIATMADISYQRVSQIASTL